MIVCGCPATPLCEFEHECAAQRFLSDFRERFSKFGPALHPDKAKLSDPTRNAAQDRAAQGIGKPETYDYLVFAHYCGKTKSGRFWLKPKTNARRMWAKLAEFKE